MEKYKFKLVGKWIVFVLFLGLCSGLFANSRPWVVVIDPGHGGRDPGAVGRISREADINLAISLGLGRKIQENLSDVNVHFTRTEDVCVPLWQRPQMANRLNADLFISIHVNSSNHRRGTPYPRGFETYVMGLHRTAENLAVAQRENASIFLEENYAYFYQGFNPNSPEAYIIFSLFQSAYLEQSLDFAARLQRHYAKHIPSVCRGVKQAGFLVLHGTTMPAVLTEIGFINNPEEERFMNSSEGQEKIIRALFDAFKEYKQAVNRLSDRREIAAAQPDTARPAIAATERVFPALQTPTPNPPPANAASTGNPAQNPTPRIVYKVQFASSSVEIPLTDPRFRGFENPGIYYHQGAFRLTAGAAGSTEEITPTLREIQNRGYRDAFIVVFKDGERITTAEALRILQSQK
ncbi:MAG: N-acetylmuramoyl-L-alanine amidase [Bacteroidales bacterium]|nr:N-acetylmuramoyl-L-alanine amidase [Bacteroidales bacterium]